MIPLKLIFQEGKGPVSSLIKFHTRSPITHVAVQLDDTVYEAKEFNGVTQCGLSGYLDHINRTVTDWHVLTVTELSFTHARELRAKLNAELGCGYDWRNVLYFVTRGRAEANNDWFCSEFAFWAALQAGVRLLNNVEQACVSPGMLWTSPLLKK